MRPLRDLPLDQLRRRTSVKWRQHGPAVLPMFVAEMDAHPVPAVVEAVERAVRDGDTGYPSGRGYAEAWNEFSTSTWNLPTPVERTRMVADVMTGIAESIRLLSDDGGGVVITPPVYPPFFEVIRRTGRRSVEAPLTEDGRLDLDAIDRAMADASIFLLCSPQNPTSVVHTRSELEAVAASAERHGVHVVVDEIHAPLADGFVPWLGVSDRGFSVMSASKAFNLAGLKAGMVAAGPRSAADLDRMDAFVEHGPSHLGVIAQVAALQHGGEWLAAVKDDLAANRAQLTDLLAGVDGVTWNGEAGTYLAWLDLRGTGLGDEPAATILERGGLSLTRGLDFGSVGAGFARMIIATTPEIIDDAIDRLVSALPSSAG